MMMLIRVYWNYDDAEYVQRYNDDSRLAPKGTVVDTLFLPGMEWYGIVRYGRLWGGMVWYGIAAVEIINPAQTRAKAVITVA